jgi:uncharacterized membrane protein HdeD (DUF308 family)
MNEARLAVRSASNAGVIWGILTILLGILAIGSPFFFGTMVSMLVAFILIASGVAQTIYAFQAGSLGRGIMKFLFGGLTVIVGIVMVGQPGLALVTLTMILGIYFLVDGLTTVVAAFHIKPKQGWGWLLFNGIVTLVLAWMIIGGWPVSGVWAIGILVGVRLLFSGMTMLTLGSAGRMATQSMDNA